MKQTSLWGDVFSTVRKNLLWFVLFMSFASLYRLVSILIPLYVGNLMDSLINTIQRGADVKVTEFISKILILIALWYFGRLFYFWTQGYFDTNILKDTRRVVFENLQDQSMRFFSEESTGDLIAIYSRDVVIYAHDMKSFFLILLNSFQIVGIVIIFFFLDSLMGILFAFFVPILWVVLKQFSQPFRELREERQHAYGKMNKVLDEGINSIKISKAYNMGNKQNSRFDLYNSEVTKLQLELERKKAGLFPKSRLINQGFSVLLLVAGGYRVASGALSPGELIVMVLLLAILPEPINFLIESVVYWNEFQASRQRLLKIIHGVSEIKDGPNAKNIPKDLRGEILFENVSFSYLDEPTLTNISFKINAGSNIAIIGTTGSGKTSILNLILRFYDPTEGRILLDGHDLKSLKIVSLRSVIGLVEQETYLFSKSIRENISIGNPDASFEEIQEAAKLASAHDFIIEFDQGYDTIIGKKGLTLSGGQRQRISIARVILFDPKIIIFDDSLSALDAITEVHIQDAIENLTKNKTTIFVTQRLSTLERLDNIILLEKGVILEMGSHDELIKNDGTYCKILTSQLSKQTIKESIS